ncbi:guanyl-nucleotide exchange factor [Purpureocillium lavendulum]|uniref:Guanyl-nucleotide exchange factor n=1 Tax=Purpureocillium lavendulum TaxID=1247861 RepID=A0AB34FXZ9_9HYPO|nr:guanyl-nucleotide exchange factor [Purpureocillium lavendulum]
MASETDMRRHTAANVPIDSEETDGDRDREAASVSALDASASNQALPSKQEKHGQPVFDDAGISLSQTTSHGSESTANRPDTPPSPLPEPSKHKRFSVLRFRNASDSQLSLRAKQQAENPPPVPRPPAIITTAPTNDITGPKKMSSRMNLAAKFRRSNDVARDGNRPLPSGTLRKSFTDDRGRPSLATLDEPASPRPSVQFTPASNGTSLTTFNNRPSESSRSDASSNDRISHPSPTTTPKKSQSSVPFFKLPEFFPLCRGVFDVPGGWLNPSPSFGTERNHASRPRREGSLTPVTPGSITSKSNSLQLSRSSVVLPERLEDESPAKYLARLEDLVSRRVIASALSKGTDPFSAAALRSYMRSFGFFGDPMDMAIRKLLMEAELPKETQQIDRCLQAFANRYHECNPGIYSSPDQAYFIAFSLLILHTDVFNKNNKHKMQKSDYLKNTRGEGIFDDILECFYDNISYTPFIHVEDDLDLSQERVSSSKSKKKQLLPGNPGEAAKRAAKEPIDPYTLILDGNLDALRPNLKDAMHLDDHYNYLGTATSLNLKDLQNTFFKTGVLQIVSARSRPDAFMSEKTATNPEDAHPGIVDIKITKVGLLWRKDSKKRKTRSPWQEWGAILTGAQLYFFRNTSWVKNLMHQYEHHIKVGNDGIPIIFQPPLEEFKPDALMSTHGAVALVDSTYKKHKNAFVYVRQGGLDEVLLADNEEERNDWLAKLNYAAAFRTSGIRMRGVVGGNYDGQGRRGIRRLDSSDATQLVQTPTGPVSIARGRIDHKMAEDIQTARRDGMQQKIAEAEYKVEDAQRQLDEQLRNARHLQILAPIQPRTREQLLSAAARQSAQLKWTRMEIWREKCHRDILIQDLAEDRPGTASTATTTPSKPQTELELPSSPTPRPLLTRLESKAKRQGSTDRSPQTPTDSNVARILGANATGHEPDLQLTDSLQSTPPASTKGRPSSRDVGHHVPDMRSPRHGSISSITASPIQSPTLASQSSRPISREGGKSTASNNDDVDAGERDFLKQAGLWELRSARGSVDKATVSTSADSAEHAIPAERDRLERSKIRRSLQRTLRDSAGHLSHHRSRRGKESAPGTASEDTPRETMLSRGTGSFVVHGKKASVINIGTEIQSMTQDEKILARKQQQQQQQRLEQQQHEPLTSPTAVDEDPEDAFHSAPETPSESNESNGRRESVASAGDWQFHPMARARPLSAFRTGVDRLFL